MIPSSIDAGEAVRLVITEKPSIARGLAQALGEVEDRESYLIAGDALLAWTVGHAVQPPRSEESLPTLADLDRLVPRTGQEENVERLVLLLRAPQFTTVVNACSATEVGELIFRSLLAFADARPARIVRFVPRSMVAEDVAAALDDAEGAEAWDGVAEVARLRRDAGRLLGIHASTLCSACLGRPSAVDPLVAIALQASMRLAEAGPGGSDVLRGTAGLELERWCLALEAATGAQPRGALDTLLRLFEGHCAVTNPWLGPFQGTGVLQGSPGQRELAALALLAGGLEGVPPPRAASLATVVAELGRLGVGTSLDRVNTSMKLARYLGRDGDVNEHGRTLVAFLDDASVFRLEAELAWESLLVGVRQGTETRERALSHLDLRLAALRANLG